MSQIKRAPSLFLPFSLKSYSREFYLTTSVSSLVLNLQNCTYFHVQSVTDLLLQFQSTCNDSNPPKLDIASIRTKIDHHFPLMSVIDLLQTRISVKTSAKTWQIKTNSVLVSKLKQPFNICFDKNVFCRNTSLDFSCSTQFPDLRGKGSLKDVTIKMYGFYLFTNFVLVECLLLVYHQTDLREVT